MNEFKWFELNLENKALKGFNDLLFNFELNNREIKIFKYDFNIVYMNRDSYQDS